MKTELIITFLLALYSSLAFGDEYTFEKLALGKWGSKPGEFGLSQSNLLGLEGMEEAVLPRDIAIDKKGNIYVADQVNSRIQVFRTKGNLNFVFSDNKNKEWLSDISGIAVLDSGKIYLHNSSKKQFGIVENNNLAISSGTFEGYNLLGLCNNNITLDNILLDEKLNKIQVQRSSSTYSDGKAVYDVIEERGTMFGTSLLKEEDILGLPLFFLTLSKEGNNPLPSPSRRIWELLPRKAREIIQNALRREDRQPGEQVTVINALNDILRRQDFYQETYFKKITLPEEAHVLLKKDVINLTDKEVQKLNRLLLEAAYEIEFGGTKTFLIKQSRTLILKKYMANRKEVYSIPLPEYDFANIIGTDGSNNLYLIGNEGRYDEYNNYITKYSKDGKLLSKIVLKPYKDIFKFAGKFKVDCNGDIYFYHHVGEAGTYKVFLKYGQYEIYGFTLKR